jgi:hypothetical protein
MLGVDPGVDQSPHRGRRRGRAEDVLSVTAGLPHGVDAIRAVGDRGGQVREYRTRGMRPRPTVGIRQCRGDLRR